MRAHAAPSDDDDDDDHYLPSHLAFVYQEYQGGGRARRKKSHTRVQSHTEGKREGVGGEGAYSHVRMHARKNERTIATRRTRAFSLTTRARTHAYATRRGLFLTRLCGLASLAKERARERNWRRGERRERERESKVDYERARERERKIENGARCLSLPSILDKSNQ